MKDFSLMHNISLKINNHQDIRKSFIPFLKNGGLFLPKDNHDYYLGEEVQIKLQLLHETDLFEFTAKVIWLPAKEITDPFTKGIGIEFCEPNHDIIRNKIASYLADHE